MLREREWQKTDGILSPEQAQEIAAFIETREPPDCVIARIETYRSVRVAFPVRYTRPRESGLIRWWRDLTGGEARADV